MREGMMDKIIQHLFLKTFSKNKPHACYIHCDISVCISALLRIEWYTGIWYLGVFTHVQSIAWEETTSSQNKWAQVRSCAIKGPTWAQPTVLCQWECHEVWQGALTSNHPTHFFLSSLLPAFAGLKKVWRRTGSVEGRKAMASWPLSSLLHFPFHSVPLFLF